MGNKNSIKSSNKKKKDFCCLCTSSCSIDEKSLSNIEKTNQKQTKYTCQSIDDLIKSLHDTSLELLINKFQLNLYLKDYLNRLKNSRKNQTFKKHFCSSTIIYPCNSIHQLLTDDLNVFLTNPAESILPNLLINRNNSYNIHEQIRSKCYFIPLTNCPIEPNDDEYKQKSISVDRTGVVITLDNNQIPIEFESSCIFLSNDLFQTGFIRIDQEKVPKEFVPFIYFSSQDNLFYLSANLIQKWFNTLILVNQTCAIAKRFLIGNKNHMTCLFKQQITNQENSSPCDNDLIFAALRLPPCPYINESTATEFLDETSEKIIDAFSPLFLSNNKKLSNDSIHIDYEHYSFALLLSRWPKILIENYSTHPSRYSIRQWPSKSDMNLIIKKSLLLIPDNHPHKWKINFDLIEEYLFELMNELTLFVYILCQQLFSQTYSKRFLIKHSFLNYCEKYGLPFSNHENNLIDLINDFLKDLSQQINKKFLPNYFNHQINLLHPNEDYNQWYDYINKCQNDGISSSSSSLITISNRPIIMKFLFDFIDQLYQTFHKRQSEFYLNEHILIGLHQKFSHENIFLEEFFNDQQIIENIQRNLTYDFERNSELVHICLNQIRKSETSLIFHYTWTIFIQYLHTYSSVLWNIE